MRNTYSYDPKKTLSVCISVVLVAVCIVTHLKATTFFRSSAGLPWQDLPYHNPTCTEAQVRANVDYITSHGGFNTLTKCPDEAWLVEWRRQLPNQAEFTSLEVGCNKATDAVFMLKLFSRESQVDLYDWIDRINVSSTFVCPPEEKSRYDALVQTLPELSHIGKYRHFCIEPVQETYNTLIQTLKSTGYKRYGLDIHQYAFTVSDDPSHVLFSPMQAGTEDVGIHSELGRVTYEVKATSVDKFVSQKNIDMVNMLKIDTEGNDPLVLLGAARTLSVMRPSYVSFENHEMGRWTTFNLKDVIDYLDNLSYECYWATKYGTLVRITSCWAAEYGQWKDWSNVACVHRGDMLLYSIFMERSIS